MVSVYVFIIIIPNEKCVGFTTMRFVFGPCTRLFFFTSSFLIFFKRSKCNTSSDIITCDQYSSLGLIAFAHICPARSRTWPNKKRISGKFSGFLHIQETRFFLVNVRLTCFKKIATRGFVNVSSIISGRHSRRGGFETWRRAPVDHRRRRRPRRRFSRSFRILLLLLLLIGFWPALKRSWTIVSRDDKKRFERTRPNPETESFQDRSTSAGPLTS